MSDTQPLKARELVWRPFLDPHSPRDIRRLLETLAYKRSGKLLELGFGGGGFLTLAARHFDSTGIDHSARRVSRIQSLLNRRISVRRGEIEQEDLGRDHFDVVAAFNILEHLHHPDDTVRKIHAGLRDTGILIGSVPNNQLLFGKISTLLTNIGDRTHISTYAPARWQQIFREAGFRQIIFFGELLFTQYLALYVRDALWPYYAFNLMFVCRK